MIKIDPDRKKSIQPYMVAGFMIGLAIGALFGFGLIQNYIKDYTEVCRDRLGDCVEAFNEVVPTAKYGIGGNYSFINVTGG